jgi:hypothetical protein
LQSLQTLSANPQIRDRIKGIRLHIEMKEGMVVMETVSYENGLESKLPEDDEVLTTYLDVYHQ